MHFKRLSVRRTHITIAIVVCLISNLYGAVAFAATNLSELQTLLSADNMTSAQAGRAVASAGDVNGDGYDDLLVGADGNDDAGSNAGAAYLIYGQSAVLSSGSLASAVQFTGEAVSDQAGISVASAGDVNADGYDDLLVGAYGNDDAGSNAGAAYLIYGQSAVLSSGSLASAVQFTGEAVSDQAGISVASAGDVNGDGYDDLLVGANGNDDGASGAGAAYLIYGQSAVLSSGSLASAVQFTGEAVSDQAGISVASAGDVNGDGYDDLLVGAYANDDAGSNAGAAYLIYGQSAVLSSGSLASAVQFTGEAVSDQAGISVASAGDVNADGYDDLLVGANGNDDGASGAGAAYLIYGQSAVLSSGSLASAVQFTGEAANDLAGYAVASAGDVNGDGYDDLLVGAYANDDAGSNAGAAYLIYGQSAVLSSGSLASAVQFTGEAADDVAGYAVASAGDVNGDGYEDILIRSTRNTIGPIYLGYLYIDEDHDGSAGSTGVFAGSDTNDHDADNDNVEGSPWAGTDCNDHDATISSVVTYFADLDADGLGDTTSPITVCVSTPPAGYVANAADINDSLSDNSEYDDDLTDTAEDDAATVASVVGSGAGYVMISYTDQSTRAIHVFTNYTGSAETMVEQFSNTGYVVVLHPKGSKIAMINPNTGEVLERIRLARKTKYSKSVIKIVDVRHDGSLNIVVTSKIKKKARLSLLKFNTATGNLSLKDTETLTTASKVIPKKTAAPKKKLVLKSSSGKKLFSYRVSKQYKLSLQ